MSDRYKIGLARNRLFAFDNTVIFVGESKVELDRDGCIKAMKMMALKEPLITSAVELDDDSSAYAVVGKNQPEISFTDEKISAVKERYEQEGLEFSRGLFEFTVCGGNTLVIAAHTIVCDSKSLLRLAKEFVSFYERKSLSVEPSDIMTFPDAASLPGNINSPVTDKISADLDSKWKKTKMHFTPEDYKEAFAKYKSLRSEKGEITEFIGEEDTKAVQSYCAENNIDPSSAFAFAFYKALLAGEITVPKKAKKMSVNTDRRFFIPGTDNCFIGAFNGLTDISLRRKYEKASEEEQLKVFQFAHYKNVTSAFKAFHDELLLMKISPEYCDASYMSAAKCFPSVAARRLADNYGCKNIRLAEFFSCDLRQQYWEELSFFSDITVSEPFKRRFFSKIDLLTDDRGSKVIFTYNKERIPDEIASYVVEKAVETVLKFKN